jgi:hypothetical protein
VLDVGLATGDLLDMVRIDEEAGKRLLEQIERRLSLHASALHGDMRHAVGLLPVAQRKQLDGRRAKKFRTFCSRVPLRPAPGTRTKAAKLCLWISSPQTRSIICSIAFLLGRVCQPPEEHCA